LIRSVEHGLLISRFHYVNEIDPSTTMLTGMTRDGTFLIEDGELSQPVREVRWVDSIDGILQRTLGVGDTVRLVSDGAGYGTRFLTGSLVPPLLVEGFQVSGTAEGPGTEAG
jgi:predicted Zn-dependent protease